LRLKILKKLTASFNPEFTGSYKKRVSLITRNKEFNFRLCQC